MNDCTEARFLRDVVEHEMVVIRDNGVSRHLRFHKPGTYCMHFDLITWPGYLCYTGDMGTYVFQRLEDMFEFFRTDRKHMHLRDGKTLAINLSYWGEKLEAVDRHGGYREWSKEKFEARVREDFTRWLEDEEIARTDELQDRFDAEVLGAMEDGKVAAYQAAQGFEIDGWFPFQDWWEVNSDEYTSQFIWCCYALAWGIQKYDESKMETVEAQTV